MNYERIEREAFESKHPCMYLTGIPEEDEDLFIKSEEEDGDYMMRCFAKEYPELSLEEFEKRYFAMDISEIEHEYTLDGEGCGSMYGFNMPDGAPLKEMAECFERLCAIFEATA